jgi:hypothetical protein
MGNKNLFLRKIDIIAGILICLCNRWNPGKENKGEREFFLNYGESRNQYGIIFEVRIVRFEKKRRKYAFGNGFRSLFGLWWRSGSAQVRTDPHGSGI